MDLVNILKNNLKTIKNSVNYPFYQRHDQTLNIVKEKIYTLLRLEFTKDEIKWNEGLFNLVLEERVSLINFVNFISESKHEFARYQNNEVKTSNYLKKIENIFEKYGIPYQ